MHTHPLSLQNLLSKRNITFLVFGVACTFGSFLIGIHSAGEVQTFQRSEAQQPVFTATVDHVAAIVNSPIVSSFRGDMDGNGTVNVNDAITAIKIIRGEHPADENALLADTDGDGNTTTADVLWILRQLQP